MAIIDNFTKEQLEEKTKEAKSMAELIRSLGYSTNTGNNNETVKKRLEHFNIDYSHFYNYKNIPEKRNPENIFIKDSTASQATVRRWYKKENYTEYKCSICGLEPFWNGKELTLILDHINGIKTDDRLENLHWVCPNCNQQLDTTGYKTMRVNQKEKAKYHCKDCGKEIYSGSIYCVECNAKHRRKTNRPDREELKRLIRTYPFTEIGKQFAVSDNTIRKWCKAENLPYRVTEIKLISDQEWEKI